MSDLHLTDDVQRIGPHPATRTELEVRAQGHYEGELSLSGSFLETQDGLTMVSVYGNKATATAAKLLLAWQSYQPMRDALQDAMDCLRMCGMEQSGAAVRVLAALSIAKGEKP